MASEAGASIRVAVLQAPCARDDPRANLATLRDACEHHRGAADLLVTPELFVTGYGGKSTHAEAAGAGAILDEVMALARDCRMCILYGFAELAEDGATRHIACTLVGAPRGSPQSDVRRLFTYRKAHLWTPSRFEADNFCPGAGVPPVVEVCGVRVAPLICFDVEVAEAARVCALQGAELLLVMGANTDPFTLDTLCRVRAFENGCHLVYANHQDGAFCGRSVHVLPTGAIGAQLAPEETATAFGGAILATVRPRAAEFEACRRRNPFFQVRQPQLYRRITGAREVDAPDGPLPPPSEG